MQNKSSFGGRVDYPMIFCILTILLIGLFNLYSATLNLPVAKYFKAQIVWVSVGFLLTLILSLVNYRLWHHIAYPSYIITLILLLAVLFMGRVSQGAQRWIHIGGLTIQPSEAAKLSVILCLAKYFDGHRDRGAMGWVGLAFPAVLLFFPFLLIIKQPDLGTGLVVVFTGIAMILFMGVRLQVLSVLVVLTLLSVPLIWKFGLHSYQRDRVITFMNPEKFPHGKGYQVIQSKIAIGSGELIGKGYLKGTQSKLQFLPKQHTDFIFSTFAEEFGFVGTTLLIALYLSFALMGLSVASGARDHFGMFVAFGFTLLIVIQALINFGMEMGMLPVVGMTLPLFSYGGSSLVTTMIALGVLLNISMKRYMF